MLEYNFFKKQDLKPVQTTAQKPSKTPFLVPTPKITSKVAEKPTEVSNNLIAKKTPNYNSGSDQKIVAFKPANQTETKKIEQNPEINANAQVINLFYNWTKVYPDSLKNINSQICNPIQSEVRNSNPQLCQQIASKMFTIRGEHKIQEVLTILSYTDLIGANMVVKRLFNLYQQDQNSLIEMETELNLLELKNQYAQSKTTSQINPENYQKSVQELILLSKITLVQTCLEAWKNIFSQIFGNNFETEIFKTSFQATPSNLTKLKPQSEKPKNQLSQQPSTSVDDYYQERWQGFEDFATVFELSLIHI
jgi:hypothetical protein